MNYECRVYRKGTLVVEKYTGIIEPNDVIDNTEKIFANTKPMPDKFLFLVDISEATLSSIEEEELYKLFKSADKYSSETIGMRLAFYTGSSFDEDFKKACLLARQGLDRQIVMVPFKILKDAMKWLGLSDEEHIQIRAQLQGS